MIDFLEKHPAKRSMSWCRQCSKIPTLLVFTSCWRHHNELHQVLMP
jgi:hypothetical protein